MSAEEMSRFASLRFEKRRRDWRLGRWTAKRALATCLKLPIGVHSLQDVEIRSAPSGAPEVFLFNQRAAVSLSLSHRAGRALCVVGSSGLSLGCDLELVESRDHSFVTDFFTVNEQKLVGSAPDDILPILVTLLWSAKESALKALNVGLRLDTTSIDISPTDAVRKLAELRQDDCSDWFPMSLRYAGDQILRGFWRRADNMVRTVVFSPLRLPACS